MITNLNEIHQGKFYKAQEIKHIFGCKSHRQSRSFEPRAQSAFAMATLGQQLI